MSEALRKIPDHLWNGREELEVLVFDIAGEMFALEAVSVQEILDLLPETVVPGAKRFVGSVINFRGKVIPLADIRLAFGMAASPSTIDSRIIVIEIEIDGEPTLTGIRTDKVHEVTTLMKASGEPPPSVGMQWRSDFIDCLVRRGSEFIIMPNLHRIFSAHHEHSATSAQQS
jgi:purine-binding chemotaxis protein CheW